MPQMPWLRLYTDTVDNETLKLLAFEDRWHYIAILCCKQQGIMESKPELLQDKLAVKLGVQVLELNEIKRRLVEVELIDDKFQPIGWDDHQFPSDSSVSRVRKYRGGARLPPDWKPNEMEIRWAQSERPDVDVATEASKFADYWHGVAGAKGRKADWPATWRNWIRNAHATPGSNHAKHKLSLADQCLQRALERRQAGLPVVEDVGPLRPPVDESVRE